MVVVAVPEPGKALQRHWFGSLFDQIAVVPLRVHDSPLSDFGFGTCLLALSLLALAVEIQLLVEIQAVLSG